MEENMKGSVLRTHTTFKDGSDYTNDIELPYGSSIIGSEVEGSHVWLTVWVPTIEETLA